MGFGLTAKRAHDCAFIEERWLPGDQVKPPRVRIAVGAVEDDVAEVIKRLLKIHGVCPQQETPEPQPGV